MRWWIAMALVVVALAWLARRTRTADDASRESAAAPSPPASVPSAAAAPTPRGERLVLPVGQRAPQSSLAEVQRRVGWSDEDVREPDEDYDPARESFAVQLPPAYSPAKRYGLVVWISANNAPDPPADYGPVLDARDLLWAGALNAGNYRKPPVRVNLALDVAAQVTARYNVDPQRVYVGGFSGGGRSASKASLLYPEVFAGGLFVCGTDYLRAVGPGPAGKPNPDWTRADQAKGHRFVLLTAAGDPNLEEIRATERAYASDGFQNARLVVAEQGGHAMPPPQIFAGALDRLEGR